MLHLCWEPNPRGGKCCGASSIATFPGAWLGYPWFGVSCGTAGRWEGVQIQQVEGLVPRVWYPGQDELVTLFGRGFYECGCHKLPAAVTFICRSLCL